MELFRSDVANANASASASADDDVTVSYDGGQWETNALTLAAPLEEGTCSGNEANIHAEKYGETRLHIVVKDRSLKADKFETFLSKGVQINAVDRLGRTALHYAAQSDDCLDYMKILLKFNADIDALDKHEEAPVHIAVRWGALQSLVTLLSFNARVDLCNTAGETPLDLANRMGMYPKIQAKLQYREVHTSAGAQGIFGQKNAAEDVTGAERCPAELPYSHTS